MKSMYSISNLKGFRSKISHQGSLELLLCNKVSHFIYYKSSGKKPRNIYVTSLWTENSVLRSFKAKGTLHILLSPAQGSPGSFSLSWWHSTKNPSSVPKLVCGPATINFWPVRSYRSLDFLEMSRNGQENDRLPLTSCISAKYLNLLLK